jgi:hypothetical protein
MLSLFTRTEVKAFRTPHGIASQMQDTRSDSIIFCAGSSGIFTLRISLILRSLFFPFLDFRAVFLVVISVSPGNKSLKLSRKNAPVKTKLSPA